MTVQRVEQFPRGSFPGMGVGVTEPARSAHWVPFAAMEGGNAGFCGSRNPACRVLLDCFSPAC